MHARPIRVSLTVIFLLLTYPYVDRLLAGPQLYTLEDVGTLGGVEMNARGVNAAGAVVGFGALSDFHIRGFGAETAGAALPIDTLGGADNDAAGVNQSGVVVGSSLLGDNVTRHAYRRVGGVVTDLGTLGGSFSSATAVNDAGAVVGYANDANGNTLAFRFTDADGLVPLGTLGGSTSVAWAVNASGAVAGQATTAGGQTHAFVWSGSMQDLGSLDGPYSSAAGLNDAGVAVGVVVRGDGTWRAFRAVPGGAMTELGSLGAPYASAQAINSAGAIVGWAYTASFEQHAFLWTAADGMVDLNTLVDPALGWTLTAAYGINDAGQIVGDAVVNGEARAFRLTPPASSTTDTTPPVIASAIASPSVLGSANHKLVPVTVTVSATDDSGAAPTCALGTVTSNEPDNGLGDGDTPGDIVPAGALGVQLRAERSGTGSGRVYTLPVVCSDASGNTASASLTVTVPRNGDTTTGLAKGRR